MASGNRVVIAFDIFGTISDLNSVTAPLEQNFDSAKAKEISKLWRTLQTEYTWRLNSMNNFYAFDIVTRNALLAAISAADVIAPKEDVERDILKSYSNLRPYSDAAPCAALLQQNAQAIYPVLFSNGTAEVVTACINQPSLSEYAHVFKKTILTDAVQKYKPAQETYRHLAESVGKDPTDRSTAGIGGIWLVSGNAWDICGAAAAGIRTCWVDRSGTGWKDRLSDGLTDGGDWRPNVVVESLEVVPHKIMEAHR